MALAERVRQKLDSLPVSPGVYVFLGKDAEVLYVGKARSLRNRVRSYFTEGGSDDRYFIALLEHQLEDIETYVVETEKEAALLENHLIKQHKPRYNFKLRDDKDFLSLKLDPQASWPRLEVVRRPKPDGARYFGPYHSATAARQTLRLVNRFFQLRTCTDTEMDARVRPCLQYQIRRCPGPCVLDVDRDEYADQVRLVGLFLDGRHDELVHDLEERMARAASTYEYERAAIYRDQLRAVERAREDQRVSTVKNVDQDVIGLHREADHGEIALLRIRNGRLVGVRTFDLKGLRIPDDEIVAAFVREYYEDGTFIPDEVILPYEIELMEGLAEVFSEARKKKMAVMMPRRGARVKLLEMARDNAAHAFKEKARAREDIEERLDEVQRRLRLPRLPHRIECVDVSHTAGEDTVAAVVALLDGAPDRKRYRSFNVEGVEAGDDYGAMYQVLARRFKRGRAKERGWELPDLFVVDGGKGQLNVALTALRDLDLTDLPVVALAKEKETAYGDKVVDRVYLPGQKNPIALRESSAALQMLALARDEAHRASNLHRTRKGQRRKLRSELDEIAGIGPTTRRKLLSALGSVRAVALADEEALVRAGASQKQAQAIHRVFHAPAPTLPTTGDADQAEAVAVENAFAEVEG